MLRWTERLAIVAAFVIFALVGVLVWALVFFRDTL
jgi:hypothetical protein